jgi:hypothetical protein
MTRAGLPSVREASAAVSNDPNSDNPHMGNSGGETPANYKYRWSTVIGATNQKKASSIASTNDWKGLRIEASRQWPLSESSHYGIKAAIGQNLPSWNPC